MASVSVQIFKNSYVDIFLPIIRNAGFNSSITPSVSALPTGVNVTFTPSVAGNSTSGFTARFSANPSASEGSFSFTISGVPAPQDTYIINATVGATTTAAPGQTTTAAPGSPTTTAAPVSANLSWTQVRNATNTYSPSRPVYQNGKFVAIGQYYTTNSTTNPTSYAINNNGPMTSTDDGVTWTTGLYATSIFNKTLILDTIVGNGLLYVSSQNSATPASTGIFTSGDQGTTFSQVSQDQSIDDLFNLGNNVLQNGPQSYLHIFSPTSSYLTIDSQFFSSYTSTAIESGNNLVLAYVSGASLLFQTLAKPYSNYTTAIGNAQTRLTVSNYGNALGNGSYGRFANTPMGLIYGVVSKSSQVSTIPTFQYILSTDNGVTWSTIRSISLPAQSYTLATGAIVYREIYVDSKGRIYIVVQFRTTANAIYNAMFVTTDLQNFTQQTLPGGNNFALDTTYKARFGMAFSPTAAIYVDGTGNVWRAPL